MAQVANPQITFRFHGIGTIIDGLEQFVPPGTDVPPARLVIPNCSGPIIDNNPNLKGRRIDPHVAKLRLRNDQIRSISDKGAFTEADGFSSMDLQGVTLTVANGIGHLTLNAPCLPRLEAQAVPSNNITQLADFVWNQDPDQASCYLNLTAGTVQGYTDNGGAGISWSTIDTNGDPVLVITPFDQQQKIVVVLRQKETQPFVDVKITNLPSDGKVDRDDDFLLSFLVANTFPQQTIIPALGSLSCPPPPSLSHAFEPFPSDVGPGCSNTWFP
jgi:hypothetical protein